MTATLQKTPVATLTGLRPSSHRRFPNVAFGNVGLEGLTASRFDLPGRPGSLSGCGLAFTHNQSFARDFPIQDFHTFVFF